MENDDSMRPVDRTVLAYAEPVQNGRLSGQFAMAQQAVDHHIADQEDSTLLCQYQDAVCRMVARSAECNQIFLRIIARSAAEFSVVNLEIRHSAARLTSPAVTA